MSQTLPTLAEQKADETRQLPSFRDFSLPGFRDHLTDLLRMIGHAGIFHTYTRHDITHVDAMLNMLEWIVPATTQQKMTPADWLLIVLAIYLHDLGMLVTQEEFDQRGENAVYRDWLKEVTREEADRDYLARTKRMTEEERERFFFQEYVREGHAARIREWITNKHSRRWGTKVAAAAAEVDRLLQPLPSRFRQHLGTVCESHHADNLDKIDLFPLFAKVGSDQKRECVNVQYAAILLRTADLLHVTWDRTPSVMFKLIKFTDPKGVSEWERQRSVFSVGPRTRELNPADPSTAEVLVDADFTEERPLFALQEYVVYANAQVEQSRRWAEKSKETPNGRDYIFPWRSVAGDVRLEGERPHKLKFELDRGRLLDLLVGHTLYNDPTVAVRELLQNAIDAVRYQHHLDRTEAEPRHQEPEKMGVVKVHWNPTDRTLIVEDNGVGMDTDVIENHLMKVGSSFYSTAKFEAENRGFTPISRFGIGILTCFMVSDDIEIVTFRASAGKGHRIRMTSVHADYLRRELREHDPLLEGIEPHGTRVKLVVRESVDLSKQSVLDILRYWIILPECGVEYHEAGKEVEAIGFASVAEALRFFHPDNPDDPLTRQIGGLEYLTKTRGRETLAEDVPGSYDLALAVRSGWFPEKSFTTPLRPDPPMVCVEGIRVSNALPGFLGDNERTISALLSVRGNRSLRTTVSRAALEQDTAAHHVGQLCIKLVVEHIRDEVTRISSLPGSPLSQASSACAVLFRSLYGSVGYNLLEVLRKEENRVPAIVVETLRADSTTPHAPRELKSRLELCEQGEFWSVESRLVDSLGLISRDLGRELSLSEFVSALAPDHSHLKYPVLVPDVSLFKYDIINSHQPAFATCNRSMQQTSIKWARCSISNDGRTDYAHGRSIELDASYRERIAHAVHAVSDLGPYTDVMNIWLVTTDTDDIDLIQSRVGILLRATSSLANLWLSIRRVLIHVMGERDPFVAAQVLRAASAFSLLTGDRVGEYRFDSRYDSRFDSRFDSRGGSLKIVRDNWSYGLPALRAAEARLSLPGRFPETLTPIPPDRIFNARSYWRNWLKDLD